MPVDARSSADWCGQRQIELVRVVDNGHGIAAEELSLAVAARMLRARLSMPTIYFALAHWGFAARRDVDRRNQPIES